jgi:chromosome segregation ATPase
MSLDDAADVIATLRAQLAEAQESSKTWASMCAESDSNLSDARIKVDQLRAQLAAMEESREAVRYDLGAVVEERNKARAQVAALAQYVRHAEDCDRQALGAPGCICGLRALLAAL